MWVYIFEMYCKLYTIFWLFLFKRLLFFALPVVNLALIWFRILIGHVLILFRNLLREMISSDRYAEIVEDGNIKGYKLL